MKMHDDVSFFFIVGGVDFFVDFLRGYDDKNSCVCFKMNY